jgi:phospholipase/carboxylesterase
MARFDISGADSCGVFMSVQPGSFSLRREPTTGLSYIMREPVAAQPTACVVLLHGVGGNETNLASLSAAFDDNVIVVLPRGPLQFGPDQYGWFRVAFTAEGPRIDATEADAARESLIRFVTQLEAAYGLTPGSTLIGGFSQGGIMSASVALSAPEKVSGFAILSGRILPELEPHVASRERLARLRAFVSHGEFDSKLPVSWAERSEQWLAQLGVACEAHRYPVDHLINADMQKDFLRWAHALIAAPKQGVAQAR